MSNFKNVYTEMLEKCFTIYQEVQMMKKIIDKIGENEDNLSAKIDEIEVSIDRIRDAIGAQDETIADIRDDIEDVVDKVDDIKVIVNNMLYDADNETLEFLKTIKFFEYLLSGNEEFSVDPEGNVACNNLDVNGKVISDIDVNNHDLDNVNQISTNIIQAQPGENPVVEVKDDIKVTKKLKFGNGSEMDKAPHLYRHNIHMRVITANNSNVLGEMYTSDDHFELSMNDCNYVNIYFNFVNNSDWQYSSYDTFEMIEGLTGGVMVTYNDKLYMGSVYVYNDNTVGDTGYYYAYGMIPCNYPQDGRYIAVRIDTDSLSDDYLDITDTIEQIF